MMHIKMWVRIIHRKIQSCYFHFTEKGNNFKRLCDLGSNTQATNFIVHYNDLYHSPLCDSDYFYFKTVKYVTFLK